MFTYFPHHAFHAPPENGFQWKIKIGLKDHSVGADIHTDMTDSVTSATSEV